MGTMEIVDVREMNKEVQEDCAVVGGCGSIRTFYRYGLGKRCIHVLRRGTVILSSTTKECFGLV